MKHKYSKSLIQLELNDVVIEFNNKSSEIIKSQLRYYSRLYSPRKIQTLKHLENSLNTFRHVFLIIDGYGGNYSFYVINDKYESKWLTIVNDDYTILDVRNDTFPKVFKFIPKIYKIFIDSFDKNTLDKIILQLNIKLKRDKNDIYYYKFDEKILESKKIIDVDCFFIIYELKYGFDSLCEVLKDRLTYKSDKFRFI